MHTVIIGAGIGGLTAAAYLRKAGHQVTVLESQHYAGGCAGTFTYQGYRFDAGATLAGGFASGGPHDQLATIIDHEWPITPVHPIAWSVHLPDGRCVHQYTDMDAWRVERKQAFPDSERFWHIQQKLADASWDVSTRPFPWPPQNATDFATLALAVRPQTLPAIPYLTRTIGDIMPSHDPMLIAFVNANLLISAQTTADKANALYGSAALELPRRGVNHINGGIGSLADSLVEWLERHNGVVKFRQTANQIVVEKGRAVAVKSNSTHRHKKSQLTIRCDNVIANVTPWSLAQLLGEEISPQLEKEVENRDATWGAFMLFLGVQADKLPADIASHHQIIADHKQSLGETNSIFISMSDPADTTRAPNGMRAVNISTHTNIAQWWSLRNADDNGVSYHQLRNQYVENMLTLADRIIPNFREAITLCLPATPVTYEQWTGRPMGMVGGFPQKTIFKARGPYTGIKNCWLVGDSVFPGQSTAGVTLGGLRVARGILRQ